MKPVLISVLLLAVSSYCCSQTPLANRVKAMVNHLSSSANVVAKYTDDRRHCLFYTMHNRLFRYDALKDKNMDVDFASEGYSRIITTFLSPDGDFIFVAVDKGSLASFYPDDGQVLWRIDSRTLRPYKVGDGYKIVIHKDEIIISKAFRCLNPQAPANKRRWTAKDHYYDAYGHVAYAKDEYKINVSIRKK
jgi:hypothetical protein